MRRLCLLGLLGFVFLVSCQASGPVPTASFTPSLALSPTQLLTLSPTPSRTVSPTPLPLLTRTPRPTQTITNTPSSTIVGPTPISVLPVLTPAEWWAGHDPTPIATPALGHDRYRLKDWSEADALELIRLLEVYAHETDTLAAAHARLNFPDAYKLVELAVRETIYRYPDTPHRKILDWRLAMAQPIAEESGSDAWILNEIEASLNQKRFFLDDLSAGLAPYGFTVVQQLTAKNLFGHGLESPVYWVRPLDLYGSQGLFFSVQGKTTGNYKVVPIYARWDLNASLGNDENSTMQIGDHNGNGLPEVVLEIVDTSGSICFSDVYVYEWDGTRFVDLTQGRVGSSDCLGWGFGDPNTPDSNTLTINAGIFPPVTEIYKWNGTYYALTDQQLSRYDLGCEDFTRILMNGWDDYRTGIEHAQSTLANWPEDAASLVVNCPDYVRFKIAIAYALHNRVNEARSTLQALEPSSSFSSAAKAFLENYHDTNQLYQSCQAAQIAYGSDRLCNLSDTFPLLIRSLHGADVSDPTVALQKNGLEIKVSRHMDLDGDGVLDWLVDTDSSNDYVNLWGLLTTGQGLQPIRITGLRNYTEGVSEQDAFKAETFEMPSTHDHLLIISFDEFKIYRLKPSAANPIVSYLSGYESGIKEHTFRQTAHGLDLELVPDLPGLIDFYRFNAATNQFEKLPLYENNIFTNGGPAEALPYIERIAKGLEGLDDRYAYTKPQFIYLLGLAYELTGDKIQAAKTYWQLWHDFPQSSYAIMARSKIEQSTP